MIWSILAILIVWALARLLKKGCEGTPFSNHAP